MKKRLALVAALAVGSLGFASTADARGYHSSRDSAPAVATPAPAPAVPTITRSGNTFVMTPATANAVTTIDGYVFDDMPYYDGSDAVDSAVEIWWALYADPNYVPLPPVTSIGVSTTVGGVVNP